GPDPVADHAYCSLRREDCAFLPGVEVADVVAGEVDSFVGLNEFPVGAVVIPGGVDPAAETPRDSRPAYIYGMREIFAVAGMEEFHGFARGGDFGVAVELADGGFRTFL